MTIFNQKESQYSHTKNKYGEDIVKVRVRSHKIQVVLNGNNPQISINWGDGNTDIANEPKLYEHSYKNYGVYGLRIQGSFDTDGSITVYNNELADDAIQAIGNLNNNRYRTRPTKISNHQGIVFQNIKDEYVEPESSSGTNTDTDTDRKLYSWGSTTQLGNNTTQAEKIWQSVTAGLNHALAIDTDGNLYAWGQNSSGQLGDGTTENRTTLTSISHPSGKAWQSVTAGFHHTLAIDADGNLYAWGLDHYGQPGARSTGLYSTTPTPISHPSGKAWQSVTAGGDYTLAIDTDGNLYGWGRNDYGQLGDETTEAPTTLTRISHPLGKTWQSVSAGVYQYSLAIDADGDLYYWGLDVITSFSRTTPMLIDHPLGKTWKSITAATSHALAIDTDDNLYGWGSNFYGQLGYQSSDTTGTRIHIPRRISHPSGQAWQSVTAGGAHTLAIDTDGNLYAGGSNTVGQLGDGTTENRTMPTSISHPSNKTWQSITAAASHSIAISN